MWKSVIGCQGGNVRVYQKLSACLGKGKKVDKCDTKTSINFLIFWTCDPKLGWTAKWQIRCKNKSFNISFPCQVFDHFFWILTFLHFMLNKKLGHHIFLKNVYATSSSKCHPSIFAWSLYCIVGRIGMITWHTRNAWQNWYCRVSVKLN